MNNTAKYTIALTKENAKFNGWQMNLSEVADMVDIVWSDVCTKEEAIKRFDDIIKQQSLAYHQLKTITYWRTIRLYDADGKQIAQEGGCP